MAATGVTWRTEQISYDDGRIRGAFDVVAFRIGGNKMAVVFADVTVRKQAEAALREAEQQFRGMFERHQAIMLLIDPDSGAIVNANVSAARSMGFRWTNCAG